MTTSQEIEFAQLEIHNSNIYYSKMNVLHAFLGHFRCKFCATLYLFAFSHSLLSSRFFLSHSKNRQFGQTSMRTNIRWSDFINSLSLPLLKAHSVSGRGVCWISSGFMPGQPWDGLRPVLCNHVMMIVVDASKCLPLCIQCFNWHERYHFHTSELFLLISCY